MLDGTVTFRLGTFNFGISQDMLGQNAFQKRHKKNLSRVVQRAIDEGELDMCAGCEVGSYKLGLGAACINIEDVLAPILPKNAQAQTVQNYLAMWGIAAVSQRCVPSLSLHTEPIVVQLSSDALEPQLVISIFEVTLGDLAGFALLGQLHVRTPSNKSTPSIATRQRMVREAMRHMESTQRDYACNPGALVLVGDPNLT